MALRRLALAGLATLASLGTAFADCVGSNLIDALPDQVHATLVAQAQAHPFASGKPWDNLERLVLGLCRIQH